MSNSPLQIVKSVIRIIIVNFRTANLVVDCLRSLSEQIPEFTDIKVYVADNNSPDDSLKVLTEAVQTENWSSWCEILPLAKNGGFAYGNNEGIRKALNSDSSVEYILLLNPDTVAHPGAVRSLVHFMETNINAGIAGSRILNPDGSTDSSAHTFHSPQSQLLDGARIGLLNRLLPSYVVTPEYRNEPHTCNWVSGASMIIRRKVIEKIGLMDAGFFLYFEEVDYCFMAHKAGWECWYVPDSVITHLEGASTGIQNIKKRRAGYWYDSRRRFFLKHYSVAGLIAADMLWFVGRCSLLLRRTLHLASNPVNTDPKWYMFDLLWGDFKAILTGKFRISHDLERNL